MSEAVYQAPRDWARVHPVSPLLGVWPVFGVVGFFWVYTSGPDWISEGDDIPDVPDGFSIHPLIYVGAAVVLAAIVVGFSYLFWYFTEYRIGDDAVYQRKGVISREHRQARLNRLQAVDVVQPLVARIFGFAKLRVEVAGGEGSATEIAYLRSGDADALRNEILVLAAGHSAPVAADTEVIAEAAQAVGADPSQVTTASAADGSASTSAPAPSLRDVTHGPPQGRPATPAAPQREMYTVPTGRLIHSMVRSWTFIILASLPILVAVAILVFGVDFDQIVAIALGGGIITTVTALAGIVGVAWTQVNAAYGFQAAISQDGIRLKHGLMETRRQTVPPGRVQAVHLKQSLLWRSKDWWKISINVAGYQDETAEVSTLLPVGSRQDALTALWLVLPDLGDPDPAGTISRAMSGKGEDGGFTASPRRSMVYDLLQWRYRGVRATDKALLIRRGWLLKELFVVPHERTQSLNLQQGPLQRALSLATITVHSTQGPVRPVAEHLAVQDAVDFMEAQASRAREGRKRQTPEQWMAAVGLREE